MLRYLCKCVCVVLNQFESLLLAVKKPIPPYTVAFGKVKNCIIIIIFVFYHWYRYEQLTVMSSLIERHL